MRRAVSWFALCAAWTSCLGCAAPPDGPRDVLRVAIPREPSTWNRLLATDLDTHIVTDQLHEPLIRLNPQTQEMEPALAESWEFSNDGTELTFHLREGVRFSDGAPFTASDVAFTFRVLNDETVASPLIDTARIDGQPIQLEVVDDATVCFRLPRRTAAVERIFDSIRILPEHRFAESLAEGTLAADTGPGADPESVVGLGPFRLKAYEPGLRIELERNMYHWSSPSSESEETYPRLSGMVFEVVPEESSQILRLRAGEVDFLTRLSPESFVALSRDAPDTVEARDLGPGMVSERFWFNLNPGSPIASHKKRWFADARFRRAISLAIDREAMARVVYAGLASPAAGSVSPASSFWRNDRVTLTKKDPDAARALLEESGFRWEGDELRDEAGNPVRFVLMTNSGNELRQRTAAFLQEDLEEIGIGTTIATVDGATLLATITGSFDYDACLLGLAQTDPDPSAEMALWLSRSPLHLWHPAQSAPATDWEARIDELMEAQVSALDPARRRELYGEVQEIVARHLPILDLVVPHAFVAHAGALENVRATPFSHALWNAEELFFGMQEKTHVAEYP